MPLRKIHFPATGLATLSLREVARPGFVQRPTLSYPRAITSPTHCITLHYIILSCIVLHCVLWVQKNGNTYPLHYVQPFYSLAPLPSRPLYQGNAPDTFYKHYVRAGVWTVNMLRSATTSIAMAFAFHRCGVSCPVYTVQSCSLSQDHLGNLHHMCSLD